MQRSPFRDLCPQDSPTGPRALLEFGIMPGISTSKATSTRLKMAGMIAHGRPPTTSWSIKVQCLQPVRAKRSRPSSTSQCQQKRRRHPWRLNSEPGLAEKAIEIASEVLDTDLTEVIETVQSTASEAVVSTQGAIQVNATIVWGIFSVFLPYLRHALSTMAPPLLFQSIRKSSLLNREYGTLLKGE